MSVILANWLPTLLGAAVFVGFALAVLATCSAIATRIEDRLMRGEDECIDAQAVMRPAA